MGNGNIPWREWIARLQGSVHRGRTDADIQEELQLHLDLAAETEQRRAGSGKDARRRAVLRFGHATSSLGAVRDQRGLRTLDELLQDVCYGVRALRRAPFFSTIVVLTLTLGVAANAVMFGIVDQMLLRPPVGIGRADSLRRVFFHTDDRQRMEGPFAVRAFNYHSYPVIAAVRDGVAAFEAAAATHRTDVSVGSGADVRSARIELTSADYFRVLDLRPAAGRFFTADEDRVPDADPVVVLSHRFWTREFAASPQVLGMQMRVEGALLTIVGVAPKGFSGVDRQPVDFWAPIGTLGRTLLGPGWESDHGRFAFGLVVRLSADATAGIANTQATAVYRGSLAAADLPPPMRDPQATALVVPLIGLHSPTGIAAEGRVGLWLLGVSVIVLLIAGANVVQLLMTRTLARRQEMKMRLALGASRGRLVRQLLTESTVLATLAAAAALVAADVGARLTQQLLLPGFAWDEQIIDVRMLVVTLGASILLALVAGLAPALFGLSNDGLRPTRTLSAQTGALRSGLLVAQTAFSVVLLVGAGLFSKSLYAVRANDVGVDLTRVIEATLPERPGGIAAADAEALYASSLGRLARIPGVERVTMMHRTTPVAIRLERATNDRRGRPAPMMTAVMPGYFSTIGASIERGRDLTHEDDGRAARVAVVNHALAAEYWPGSDPLGQCLHLGSDSTCTEVVGVVENTLLDDRIDTTEGRLFILTSHPFGAGPPTRVLVRASRDDARSLIPTVRSVLQTLMPTMPFVPVQTMEERTAPQLRPWRLGTTMFLLFGSMAGLVAAVGLYSAVSDSVSRRTHEIGVRMALGASRWRIVTLVSAQTAATIAIGLAVGLSAAFVSAPWLEGLLYGTAPHDPSVFWTVAGVLIVASVAAAVVPTRRATRVNPLDMLKSE